MLVRVFCMRNYLALAEWSFFLSLPLLEVHCCDNQTCNTSALGAARNPPNNKYKPQETQDPMS